MEVLRTPEERFAALPDFAFPVAYEEVEADGIRVRMAYVHDGPADGPAVLLLHGEPSWSFLYRKMIGPLAAQGLRVVAPDLVGFGRSDKPDDRDAYTYDRHVAWLRGLLDAIDLRDITLFCQDWGGLLGLRIAGEDPARFAGIVVSNTGLPTGEHPLGEAFEAWRTFSQTSPEFEIGRIVQAATTSTLSDAEVAAYDAPFPDDRFKAGARQFPALVPSAPDAPGAAANREAWQGLMAFAGRFVCAFGDSDPITRGGEKPFLQLVPGAVDRGPITGAAHFCQEDAPEALAAIVAEVALG